MRFTLAQLEAFASIVEAGTFHGAARRLNVTQPTITQRIRELEAALRTRLFLRNGPRFQLTAEGQALVDYAQRVLTAVGEVRAHYNRRDSLQGVVRLGVPNLFGILCLSDLLRRLEERYPGIKASVRLHDSVTLAQMLEDRDLDIAILVEPTVGPRIRSLSVGRTRYRWLAASGVRLPRVLRPQDLVDRHVILYPPPSRLYAMVMSWFADAGVQPARVSLCNNFAVTIEAIASGMALGVLPQRAMALDTAQGRLRGLTVTPALPLHRMSICYQSGALGPASEVVVALMRDLIVEHRLFER